jgi:hypothetical protein
MSAGRPWLASSGACGAAGESGARRRRGRGNPAWLQPAGKHAPGGPMPEAPGWDCSGLGWCFGFQLRSLRRGPKAPAHPVGSRRALEARWGAGAWRDWPTKAASPRPLPIAPAELHSLIALFSSLFPFRCPASAQDAAGMTPRAPISRAKGGKIRPKQNICELPYMGLPAKAAVAWTGGNYGPVSSQGSPTGSPANAAVAFAGGGTGFPASAVDTPAEVEDHLSTISGVASSSERV